VPILEALPRTKSSWFLCPVTDAMRSRGHSAGSDADDVDAAKGRRGVMKYVGEIEVPHSHPRAQPHARLAYVAVASSLT